MYHADKMASGIRQTPKTTHYLRHLPLPLCVVTNLYHKLLWNGVS